MPLTLKVGLSRGIKLPDSSLSVTCGIEVTIDVASLQDVDGFDQTVKEAYSVCRDAIDGELLRQGIAVNVSGMPMLRNRFACACETSQREFTVQKQPEDRPS